MGKIIFLPVNDSRFNHWRADFSRLDNDDIIVIVIVIIV